MCSKGQIPLKNETEVVIDKFRISSPDALSFRPLFDAFVQAGTDLPRECPDGLDPNRYLAIRSPAVGSEEELPAGPIHATPKSSDGYL